MKRNGLNNPFLTQNKGTTRVDAKISTKKVYTTYKKCNNEVDETL